MDLYFSSDKEANTVLKQQTSQFYVINSEHHGGDLNPLSYVKVYIDHEQYVHMYSTPPRPNIEILVICILV
jgi:hypothetical protein